MDLYIYHSLSLIYVSIKKYQVFCNGVEEVIDINSYDLITYYDSEKEFVKLFGDEWKKSIFVIFEPYYNEYSYFVQADI